MCTGRTSSFSTTPRPVCQQENKESHHWNDALLTNAFKKVVLPQKLPVMRAAVFGVPSNVLLSSSDPTPLNGLLDRAGVPHHGGPFGFSVKASQTKG